MFPATNRCANKPTKIQLWLCSRASAPLRYKTVSINVHYTPELHNLFVSAAHQIRMSAQSFSFLIKFSASGQNWEIGARANENVQPCGPLHSRRMCVSLMRTIIIWNSYHGHWACVCTLLPYWCTHKAICKASDLTCAFALFRNISFFLLYIHSSTIKARNSPLFFTCGRRKEISSPFIG
jgi:hypothetical protein